MPQAASQLTDRQWEILGFIAKGLSNKEISNLLGISFYTVKNHAANILELLQASNRTEATLIYNQLRQEQSTANNSPSIAVLPFDYDETSIKPYLITGLVADLVQKLSNWRSFPVIASTSTQSYQNSDKTRTEIAAQLGARFLVAGTVATDSNQLRLWVEAIDMHSGDCVWSQRYERPLDDFFAVQDELATQIVAALYPELANQSYEQHARQTTNLDVWAIKCRGNYQLQKRDAGANFSAEQCFQDAIAQDADNLNAWYGLALTYYQRIFANWHEGDMAVVGAIIKAADQCQAISPRASQTHMARALAEICQGQIPAAAASLQTAVDANPSFAQAHSVLGQMLMMTDATAGINNLQRAIELSPQDPNLWSFQAGLAMAYFCAGDYQNAATQALMGFNGKRSEASTLATLVASYGQLGHKEAALDAVGRLMSLFPDYALANYRGVLFGFQPEQIAKYGEGLRLAGLPQERTKP